jgi:hypothetical protein
MVTNDFKTFIRTTDLETLEKVLKVFGYKLTHHERAYIVRNVDLTETFLGTYIRIFSNRSISLFQNLSRDFIIEHKKNLWKKYLLQNKKIPLSTKRELHYIMYIGETPEVSKINSKFIF